MVYGIIAALDEEIRLLLERLEETGRKEVYGTTVYTGRIGGQDVVLCKSGIATINAALCTSLLIREFGAQALINTGIAGALGKGVRMLDVVISSEAAYHDKDTPILEKYYPFKTCFAADADLIARAKEAAQSISLHGKPLAIHVGRVATGDWFVCERSKKEDIVNRLSPLCAEMEGAAVANAAYLNGCPFVIIRAMSDCADEEAHESYDNLIEDAAQLSASIVLGMLEKAE